MSDLALWELGNRLHSVFYPKEAAKKANRQPSRDVLLEGGSVRKIFMDLLGINLFGTDFFAMRHVAVVVEALTSAVLDQHGHS